MPYNLDMEETINNQQEKPVKKKDRFLRFLTILVTMIATLFVIWCIIVTVYPRYKTTYATQEFTGEEPETVQVETYRGSGISSHFQFTGFKKEYLAIRSVVSVRKEYHYELSFTSSDLFFMVENLEITLTFESGEGSVEFPDAYENITAGAFHLIVDQDLGQIVSYAPSSTSTIMGYNTVA